MATDWFNARKAAQVAAFFAVKQGDSISVLKLAKLIYLADRQHMKAFGCPILDDQFVSMPHGPANSITLNYINGEGQEDEDWNSFIQSRLAYSVGAVRRFDVDELDELSDADVQSLNSVWEEFGHMTKWQLRDWTHDNCKEWEDPHGSAYPIPHSRIYKFLNFADAEELADSIEDERTIEKVFSSLRA